MALGAVLAGTSVVVTVMAADRGQKALWIPFGVVDSIPRVHNDGKSSAKCANSRARWGSRCPLPPPPSDGPRICTCRLGIPLRMPLADLFLHRDWWPARASPRTSQAAVAAVVRDLRDRLRRSRDSKPEAQWTEEKVLSPSPPIFLMPSPALT